MYKNTGEKIKNFAITCAISEMMIFIIFGLVLIIGFLYLATKSPSPDIPDLVLLAMPIVGIIIAVIGSLVSWTKYLLLAGFGELIQNTYELSNDVKDIKEMMNCDNIDDSDTNNVE